MTAHMVSMIYSRDNSWIAEYSANVPAIIAKHGGSYTFVSRGKVEVAEGDLPVPSGVGTFTFPSRQAIHAFLESEEYRPYLELRQKYSTNQILMFDGR
ncbi:DUF1330 domain-containing protein [Sphingobium sp. HBC34]|uniref:DUF1330 domain-containing protein n=1 Tax=Sphingobium cyanobacteriorum TaxID=3063954 RepID=A0ABT8ZHM9_9SPHN|nr:DUF1330 domain-containing protein [Sphingobium sp. HBC34]MDO7833692.1 DUF1330 domain-containing protein [Sphingobium sp. HBC34]